jgi:aspartate-semialdehyde dehydrogenase
MDTAIPKSIANSTVLSVMDDADKITKQVDFVFCALDADKEEVIKIENLYAELNIPVVSNNSANRWTGDVPMIIPEVNPEHLDLIPIQQKNRGWKKGFIVVKPNCSVQSFVPLITALKKYRPDKIVVTTMQAVSGAGKTLKTWPEMQKNVIPYIDGEEKKSEEEPLKIWATLKKGKLIFLKTPKISATCIRVPVEDGHMASVSASFGKKLSLENLFDAWHNYENPIKSLRLPSSPNPFITVFKENDRPQTQKDCEIGGGMGISVGRVRSDVVLDYKFVGLSHNTIRGAAGGAILTAELLKTKGYI